MADRGSDLALTHDDYTVGWICALSKEQTAATVMLDKKHPVLPKPPTDSNTYTLGSIGGHNIVIACLPEGEMGNNPAERVATHMISTFPSIKFGLMVRLGDVVISIPTGKHPGVVQWDRGKMNEGGKFERTGSLNRPPNSLLTALTKLKTEHEMVGPKIPTYLEELGKKYPRLAPKYLKSDSLQDPLLDPESSKSREIGIHYGLIASGNEVIKDATFREKLNADLDDQLLCVEMEAAGLMNNFPCLVIRGICDYADSQKNKDWQEHAAAVAAAFGKELLQYVQPSDVEGERPAKDVLKHLDTVSKDVAQIRARSDSKEDTEILNWITPVDYGLKQSDFIRRRQPGTGQWFINSEKFQEWLKTSKQTLFCPGIPGAGKSIMTSIVLEYLNEKFGNNSSVGIAHIYCDFKRQDVQKKEDLLASILKQLARGKSFIPENVKTLHERHKSRGTRPSLDEISESIRSVTSLYSRLFIVIDALDECRVAGTSWSTFLSQLLFNIQANSAANIFATSRYISDIEREFEGRSSRLDISARNEDIEKYLDDHISELPLLDEKNKDLSGQRKEEFKKKIKVNIAEAVNGMFLMAWLHLLSLIDKTTPYDLNVALNGLPKGENALPNAYARAIERIRSQSNEFRFLAERVLTWLTCAERLLTISELRDALAVREGTAIFDEEKRESTSIMVTACAGLVTIDEDSDIIRLVHETTREYLMTHMSCIKPQKESRTFADPMEFDCQKNDIALAEAHKNCTAICVTYLMLCYSEIGIGEGAEFLMRLELNEFYIYAACNWGHHARKDGTLQQGVIEFLESGARVPSQILLHPRILSRDDISLRHGMGGLNLAAYFGISKAVDKLLKLGYNPYREENGAPAPLWYAALSGHEAVINLMLSTDVYFTCDKYDAKQNALQIASQVGHSKVIEKLLEAGADINSTSSRNGRIPICEAAREGRLNIIELLLKAGADVNARGIGGTAIQEAAREGLLKTVERLLEAGAEVNASHIHGTAIQRAAGGGHLQIVEKLLEAGADVNAPCSNVPRNRETALQRAVGGGHLQIIEKLLEAGADVNASPSKYGTAIQRAVKRGGLQIIEKLLEAGADVNAPPSKYGTALQIAVGRGHLQTFEILLEAGADVNAPSHEYGGTALQGAVEGDHLSIIATLLEAGADVNADFSGFNRTVIQIAAERGYLHAIEMLIEAGADVNVPRRAYENTVLQIAIEGGNWDIIDRLKAAGAR